VAGQPSFPPFQTENFASQLLWLGLTFVLLYVLMSRIALPRIGAIMAERSKQISEHVAAAQSLKEQADAAHDARDKALAAARSRAQTLSSLERERLVAADHDAMERLEARLRERLAAASGSIAAARSTAMGNIWTVAAGLAPAIVQRLTGKAPAAPDVAAAMAETRKPRGSVHARS
jgi:F-type H+-transporting ATPase subunit b